MARFDCAGQGFCIGGNEVSEEFDALGFCNGGAGFGVVTGGGVLIAVPPEDCEYAKRYEQNGPQRSLILSLSSQQSKC